jgi:nicotinamide riboside kinase
MEPGEETPSAADRFGRPRTGAGSSWSDLDPAVRAGLVRRIVIVGAESTGTTTLAGELADRLSVPWVPEFLRHYCEVRAEEAGTIWDVVWTAADFDEVADGQDRIEREVISAWVSDPERSRPGGRGPLVICDTDALATALWSRRYLGPPAPRFLQRAAARPPALYLLTSPEGVEFHQDGLRDGEHIRGEMADWFRVALREQEVPWAELTGDRPTRVRRALQVIDRVLGAPVLVDPWLTNEQRRR